MTEKPPVDVALIEEHVEDLYEHAPCGYLSILEDGTIVKINQTLLGWLSYDRSEVLHKKRFQELLSMGGRIFFETHFAPLVKMQGFANEIYFDLVCKNRKTLPVLTSTTQRKKNDNSTRVNRITVFNITDRKKYEHELLQERRRAENAARAKSEFLSMMSHEIRTPMNAVVGIANLLERTELTAQQREYTSMLRTSSENLLNLLNGILDMSKIEAGKVSVEESNFDLRKLVKNSVYSLISRAEEKGLPLRMHFQGEVPQYVIGDPVKIGQVLANFVGNAIKFTDQGGIDVKVTNLAVRGEVAAIKFEVSDTGIGISPDRLSKIFDEFTQADYGIGMKYGGSGLGLAISYRLVEMLGSRIKVESKLGKGSTFSFELDLRMGQKEEDEFADTMATAEDDSLTGLRILVAEDNPDNLFILTQFFRVWGIIYEAVSNGKEAIEKVGTSEFDLILMDLRMPVMTGYEAASQIRKLADEKLRRIPMIAFSASTKVDVEDEAAVSGFDDIIGKPFRPEDLFAKIASLTNRNSKPPSAQPDAAAYKQPRNDPPNPQADLFSLTTYQDIFADDKVALNEMVSLVIQSYKDALPEILNALATADLAKFEFQVHRISNSMAMLEANAMKRVIEKARGALRSEGVVDEELAKSVQMAFQKTVAALLEVSATRPRPE